MYLLSVFFDAPLQVEEEVQAADVLLKQGMQVRGRRSHAIVSEKSQYHFKFQ